MKTIYIFILILILSSCGSTKNRSTVNTVNNKNFNEAYNDYHSNLNLPGLAACYFYVVNGCDSEKQIAPLESSSLRNQMEMRKNLIKAEKIVNGKVSATFASNEVWKNGDQNWKMAMQLAVRIEKLKARYQTDEGCDINLMDEKPATKGQCPAISLKGDKIYFYDWVNNTLKEKEFNVDRTIIAFDHIQYLKFEEDEKKLSNRDKFLRVMGLTSFQAGLVHISKQKCDFVKARGGRTMNEQSRPLWRENNCSWCNVKFCQDYFTKFSPDKGLYERFAVKNWLNENGVAIQEVDKKIPREGAFVSVLSSGQSIRIPPTDSITLNRAKNNVITILLDGADFTIRACDKNKTNEAKDRDEIYYDDYWTKKQSFNEFIRFKNYNYGMQVGEQIKKEEDPVKIFKKKIQSNKSNGLIKFRYE